MVVSMGEWSAPMSQFTSVAWCCSARMSWATGTRSGPFVRRSTCFMRRESSSTPFIRMMRTRVKASSSSLLIGLRTRSFQLKVWRSSGVPRSVRRLMAMSGSDGSEDLGVGIVDDDRGEPVLDHEQVLLLLSERAEELPGQVGLAGGVGQAAQELPAGVVGQ